MAIDGDKTEQPSTPILYLQSLCLVSQLPFGVYRFIVFYTDDIIYESLFTKKNMVVHKKRKKEIKCISASTYEHKLT